MFLFILGTLLASFTQVLAHRWGRQSILFPPSHCHHCQKKLAPWQLIPIFSFFLQLGACPSCQKPIPLFYPLMEIAGGLVSLLAASLYLANRPLDCLLLVALFLFAQIDLEQEIVPNTWILSLLGCLFILELPSIERIILALCLLFLLFLVDARFPNKIGGADLKFFCLFWLFTSSYQTSLLLLYSTSFALLFLFISKEKRQKIPFFPFIFMGFFIISLSTFFHT